MLRAPFRRLTQHRVARNAGALGLVQVANYASSFLVLVHLTRVLGVGTYGVVAFAVGITQVLSVVLDLGFAMSGTQWVAAHRDDKPRLARFVGAVLVLKLAALALGAVLLAAYAAGTVKYAAYAPIFVLSVLPLVGHALQPVWLFQGIEQMRHVTVFTVLAKLSFVGLVFLLVGGEQDFLYVPVADGIAQGVAAAVGLALIRRVGHSVAMPSRADLREALAMTSGFFVSRLAQTVQTNAGVLLLGLVAAPPMVALYALAEQLYRAMHSAFAPVVHALYPHMARTRDVALLAKVTLGCTAVAVVGSVVGHFLGPVIIPPLLGEEWRAALPVLDIFFVAIVVHVLVLMSGYPLAAALGRLEVANRSVIIGSVLHLAVAGVLVAMGLATPPAFAWLLVLSESYLLLHCAVALLPAARRELARA
jgi:PST family polysaccharide transporter